jgi:subtilisin family serine protease
VAGIIGANGMLTGVAPNAQILGIKVLSNDGVGTTDDLVKGIEDAVKLGADIINMSLGYKCTVKSDEDYLQSAINEAKESGVLCAIAAGNDGSSASGSNSNNLIGAIDTSAVGSPAVSNGSFCVASVDNISEDINDEDVRNSVVMSDFSSWGPTNELNIKPEIAAPGGNINSLYDGWSSYVELSGTSMATPYISGCSALVLNSIKARKLNIPEDEFTKYIKSTLINTATPLTNPEDGQPYSVRYQGAGLVDTFNAVRNDVIITCNDEAKIELGEINESNNNTTFTINLKNYGTNDARYRINCETLYSNYTDKETGAYGIIPVEGSGVVFDTLHNNEVCVKKGEDISITCTIELGDLESESFIEGFISFENLYDNDSPSLNIPLLGFYGDWSKETIIDSSIYSGEESVFAKE